jgi:hypothetical protein
MLGGNELDFGLWSLVFELGTWNLELGTLLLRARAQRTKYKVQNPKT